MEFRRRVSPVEGEITARFSVSPCVVYALMQGQHIVYIGESTSLPQRVKLHQRDKNFNAVNVIFEGNQNICFRMEAEYLLDYYEAHGQMPLYNRCTVKGMRRRLHRLAANGGLRRRTLNRLRAGAIPAPASNTTLAMDYLFEAETK